VKTYACQVMKVVAMKDFIYQVRLRLPAGRLPDFSAGQYLAITLPSKEAPNFFSIASAPGEREIELHVQADPHLATAVELIETLQQSPVISVTLPFGKACLPAAPSKPLLLLAAGTGFAQMKSIVEYVYARLDHHPVTLYWGVRREEDMYLRDLAEAWQRENKGFRFVPLIADDSDAVAGIEHHNQLADAVIEDNHDLENCEVFVSGSPRLVFSALDELVARGLPKECFHSDVFEYASPED